LDGLSKGLDPSNRFVKKMFETSFRLAGTIKIHSRDKFLSKLYTSERGWMPSIDDGFRKYRLIPISFAFSLSNFGADSNNLRKRVRIREIPTLDMRVGTSHD
jgi:hypothetical protein